ncbi:hypothetical protein GCM10025778_35280 [Paeniglutamicibacter antarcticus]|uniref:Uncharacterized protein n=2 Tax=Paeniglutamicibacter antarcticus TaxID=494023 RepID=A0ABP9TQH7_9MICC
MIMLFNNHFPIPLVTDLVGLRAAEAAEATAFWTLLLAIGTFGLLAGAVAAAIFAGLTWKATRSQLNGANEQLAMARKAKLEAEADNVSAWLMHDGGNLGVFVRNGNSGPVYDMNCELFFKPDDKSSTPSVPVNNWASMAVPPAVSGVEKELRFALNSDGYVFAYTDQKTGIDYNKNRQSTVLMKTDDDWKPWNGSAISTGLAVRISFRDSSGVYWRRDWDGKVTQQDLSIEKS